MKKVFYSFAITAMAVMMASCGGNTGNNGAEGGEEAAADDENDILRRGERGANGFDSLLLHGISPWLYDLFGADENAAKACFPVTSIIYHATLLLDVSLNRDPQKNRKKVFSRTRGGDIFFIARIQDHLGKIGEKYRFRDAFCGFWQRYMAGTNHKARKEAT